MFNSQPEILKLRKTKFSEFSQARESCQVGKSRITSYGSLAIREIYNKFESQKRIPIFHEDYEPIPTHFQYDMELYIFLHFDELLAREKELNDKIIKTLDRAKEDGFDKRLGPCLLTREEHLMNAMSIRWPERPLPNGQIAGTIVRTPWIEDFFYGVANYDDTIMMGGAGQGKTYGPLAFMTMMYDHFIHTKGGAQCSFSTVSGAKMENSSWPMLNKLQSHRNKYIYSLYGGKAVKATDYTYKRLGLNGKYLEEGGMFRGVLLQAGRKDAKSIDKLTGSHDAICKIYLLDEMQSTDSAPLDAYTNIFLHPKYQWFFGSGNYEREGDLLDKNTEPVDGWPSVNESTHMWEGRLKSLIQDLGRTTLVIHYNNDLSPAMTDPEMARKYAKFMPTPEKKKKLYPEKEQEGSYGYRRFWIGFKFAKYGDTSDKIITYELLEETKCSNPIDFKPLINVASFDSAAASVDGNTLTIFGVGLDENQYPKIAPINILCFKKPSSALKYYEETSSAICNELHTYKVSSGNMIMDWTNRTALIEELAKRGIVCHHLIYQQSCPKVVQINEVTRNKEEPILLDKIRVMGGPELEKISEVWAHEVVRDRISLCAYLFRMFVEKGCFRGINSKMLEGKGLKSFEKEMLTRSFKIEQKKGRGMIAIDSKDLFKRTYEFSPDVLDTFLQVCYLLFVIFKIHPNQKGLGLLKTEDFKKPKDKRMSKLWAQRDTRF